MNSNKWYEVQNLFWDITIFEDCVYAVLMLRTKEIIQTFIIFSKLNDFSIDNECIVDLFG